jgi:alpha-ribazole phosphatase
MEMNFGEWEGRAWDDVPRPALDAWAKDVANYTPPGGESPKQVLQRALAFFAENDSEEMVVVTHAGVIKLLMAFHRNQPLETLLEYPVPYGGVTAVYCFRHIYLSEDAL